MQLEELISDIRITTMSYDDLMKRIRGIREARVNYVPTPVKKATTRTKAKRKSKLEKMLEGLSESEKEQLLKDLEGG